MIVRAVAHPLRRARRAALVALLALVVVGCAASKEQTAATGTLDPSPTASASTTSTSSTTSTTTTTTRSTTTSSRTVVLLSGTIVPYEVGFYVRGTTGFETVAFGEDSDFVLGQLGVILGGADRDTGWRKDDTCDGSATRRVYWGGFEAVFTKGANGLPPASLTFQQWHLTGFGMGMLTPEGVGIGSTVADLKRAYPAVKVTRARASDTGALYITKPEGGPFMQGFTSDTSDRAVITEMWAGLACQRILGA